MNPRGIWLDAPNLTLPLPMDLMLQILRGGTPNSSSLAFMQYLN